MLFTRFTIEAGQIASRVERDVRELDPPLLLKAAEILTKLRGRAGEIVYADADTPAFLIGLGTSHPVPWEMVNEAQTSLDRPPDMPRVTRERWERARQYSRQTGFYIRQDETDYLFAVVHSAARENDPELFGTIAGSSAGAQIDLPERQRDKRAREEQSAEHKAIAAQIWSARPALVCSSLGAYFFSAFADCFGAAMLLNPEISHS